VYVHCGTGLSYQGKGNDNGTRVQPKRTLFFLSLDFSCNDDERGRRVPAATEQRDAQPEEKERELSLFILHLFMSFPFFLLCVSDARSGHAEVKDSA
jgi:hypothetical protein